MRSTKAVVRGSASKALWASVGVGVLSLLVYILTLLPTVGASGDTPKFQFISAIWGIPHPSGYPLYVLLGRIFGLLPFGSVAWRVNLMSAFFGALVASISCRAGFVLTRNVVVSASFALVLAFARLIWSQAVVAEVYTLNAFFVVSVICCLLLWKERRQRRFLYLAMLLYALSFGNHLSMVFLLPAWVYWVCSVDWRTMVDRKAIGIGIASVLAGALPYLYILIRARQHPLHCEACPDTWPRFLNYLFRPRFGGTSFNFETFRHPVERLSHIADLFWTQLWAWDIALALIGIVALWRRERKTTVFLLICAVGSMMWPMNYSLHIIVFYIPALIVFTFFGAAGMATVVGYLNGRFQARALVLVIQVALSIWLVGWQLGRNWLALDQSHNRAGERLCQVAFDRLAPGSVLYAADWGLRQAAFYWHYVEQPQRDVDIAYSADVVHSAFGRRPVYVIGTNWPGQEQYLFDPPRPESLSATLRRIPDGMIVAMVAKDEASYGLTGEAVAALGTIGGTVDLRGCWRCGHILIGVKGAEPGMAFEVHGYRRLLSKYIPEGGSIGQTGVQMPVSLVARSAGLDAGNVGDLIVDGVNVSPLGRGYNVVVIDPETGDVLQATNRDTAIGPHLDGAGFYEVIGRRDEDRITPADPSSLAYWAAPERGIDFGDPDSRRYMGRGWGNVEDWGTWAQGEESVLNVVVPPQFDRVVLTAMPFAVEGMTQSVELAVNGVACGKVAFAGSEVQDLVFDLPAGVSLRGKGIDYLAFRFAYAKSPQEVSGVPDARKLSVWFVHLGFVAE